MHDATRPVVFSGAQPTGGLTLGNHLGALRHWVALQADHDCIFCIVDLHALTVRQEPEQLRTNIYDLAALYIACGIDPERSTMFIQSHVPAHAGLTWLLSTFTQMGELERMTQFKDKAQRQQHNVNVGLFTYPVLMAADILLYQTDKVPVGEDQKQHLELARDIAIRVNGLYGPVLRVPEPLIAAEGARIKDLQDPTRKMSKTAHSELAKVMLLDEPQEIIRKFQKSVTDSRGMIEYNEQEQPGVANLINIWCAATGQTRTEALEHFSHHQYGRLKRETADAVVALLTPVRERFLALKQDPDALRAILRRGAERASERAEKNLYGLMQAMGLR